MYGLPKCLIKKTQLVQTTAARIVSCTKKHDHITPVLKMLHWLPIQQRIEFKILLLTYKALNGLAPAYLKELITVYCPNRPLRSADSMLLQIPATSSTNLTRYSDRAFSKAAPVLWNKLPTDIRKLTTVQSFKNKLKTHLFIAAFGAN